jgi:phosphatidylserine decarboxylase
MTIHKEGSATIAITAIVFAVINLLSFYLLSFSGARDQHADLYRYIGLLIFIILFSAFPNALTPLVKTISWHPATVRW